MVIKKLTITTTSNEAYNYFMDILEHPYPGLIATDDDFGRKILYSMIKLANLSGNGYCDCNYEDLVIAVTEKTIAEHKHVQALRRALYEDKWEHGYDAWSQEEIWYRRIH